MSLETSTSELTQKGMGVTGGPDTTIVLTCCSPTEGRKAGLVTFVS